MGNIGFAIFSVGVFLTAAYASYVPTLEGKASAMERISAWFEVGGLPFIGGLVLMIIGAVVARRAKKSPANKKDSGDQRSALELLSSYETSLATLKTAVDDNNVESLKQELETLVSESLPLIWEQRESLLDTMGLEKFAEFAGSLSSMERNTARAWSALTDDVLSEVGPSLSRASDSLGHAKSVAEATLS